MSSVARNTTFLTASFVLQKVLAFVYFTLIARITGVSFTGSYVYALSFTTMFSVIVDIGLSPVLVREIARDRTMGERYLSTILGMKAILGIIAFFAIILTIGVVEHDPLTKFMVYIASFLMLTDSFVLTFWSVFRGFQDLRFEAIGIILSQSITFIVGIGGLLLGFPLYVLIVALLMGSLANLCLALVAMVKRLGIQPHFRIESSLVKTLFAIGIPFALLHVLTRLLFTVDVVILRKMADVTYVGWYAVANKITFAFQFIPSAFAASLFPAMSQAFVENKERLRMLYEKSTSYLIIAALPLSMGVMMLAPDIIHYLYTNAYEPSIPALQIIIWSSALLFLSFPIGALLNATNHHKRNALHLGIAVIVNIILNILLIPQMQHVGSAIASLVAWAVLLTLNTAMARSIVAPRFSALCIQLLKVAVATMVMGTAVYVLQSISFVGFVGVMYRLALIPLVGAIVYTAMVFMLRIMTWNEVLSLRDRVLKR